nr:hypothetical protein [Deinococcus arboris]
MNWTGCGVLFVAAGLRRWSKNLKFCSEVTAQKRPRSHGRHKEQLGVSLSFSHQSVWRSGIKVSCVAFREQMLFVSQNQPEVPREDVQPLLTVVLIEVTTCPIHRYDHSDGPEIKFASALGEAGVKQAVARLQRALALPNDYLGRLLLLLEEGSHSDAVRLCDAEERGNRGLPFPCFKTGEVRFRETSALCQFIQCPISTFAK